MVKKKGKGKKKQEEPHASTGTETASNEEQPSSSRTTSDIGAAGSNASQIQIQQPDQKTRQDQQQAETKQQQSSHQQRLTQNQFNQREKEGPQQRGPWQNQRRSQPQEHQQPPENSQRAGQGPMRQQQMDQAQRYQAPAPKASDPPSQVSGHGGYQQQPAQKQLEQRQQEKAQQQQRGAWQNQRMSQHQQQPGGLQRTQHGPMLQQQMDQAQRYDAPAPTASGPPSQVSGHGGYQQQPVQKQLEQRQQGGAQQQQRGPWHNQTMSQSQDHQQQPGGLQRAQHGPMIQQQMDQAQRYDAPAPTASGPPSQVSGHGGYQQQPVQKQLEQRQQGGAQQQQRGPLQNQRMSQSQDHQQQPGGLQRAQHGPMIQQQMDQAQRYYAPAPTASGPPSQVSGDGGYQQQPVQRQLEQRQQTGAQQQQRGPWQNQTMSQSQDHQQQSGGLQRTQHGPMIQQQMGQAQRCDASAPTASGPPSQVSGHGGYQQQPVQKQLEQRQQTGAQQQQRGPWQNQTMSQSQDHQQQPGGLQRTQHGPMLQQQMDQAQRYDAPAPTSSGPPSQVSGHGGYQQQPVQKQLEQRQQTGAQHQQKGPWQNQQISQSQDHQQQPGGLQRAQHGPMIQQQMDQAQRCDTQTPAPSGLPSHVSDVQPQTSKEHQALSPLVEGTALVKPGTRGKKIVVESNHVSLNIGKITTAVHYDVAITPDTPKGLLRQVMMQFQRQFYPNRSPAFDGRKNLYSPTLLPFGKYQSGKITVQGENRDREFEVVVQFAREVDLTPLHDMLATKASPMYALQCVDVVLRNAPSNACISVGRCFFTPPRGTIISLGEGMEMYYGFYQSAIRGWKPLLNIDIAHKAFPKCQPAIDTICELTSLRREDLRNGLNDYHKKTCDKYFKTLKVNYEIPNQAGTRRVYRVNGLGPSPRDAKFTDENGKVDTVENYYSTTKRYRLNYPTLPTVWVGAKDRPSKIYLPVEFCEVVAGQAVARKMTEKQTTNMIRQSATSTTVRKQKILGAFDASNYNGDPCIREFGFSVGTQFERLNARVLPPPMLKYRGGESERVSKGVWRNNNKKFLIGAKIDKWTVASVDVRYGKMDNLADMIYRFAASSGIVMTSKAQQPFVQIGGRQIEKDLAQYLETKKDFDLIFVVIPDRGHAHSYVKRAAELKTGCLTQCIKNKTLDRLNPQIVTNILLKVNSKMNGTNHELMQLPSIMSKPCMLMGADVTHPSPEAKDIPSVAAVIASHDLRGFQYNICWRLQPPKKEIIADLCAIVKKQLKYFYGKTGQKPERIVMFRDGVSEGQFGEVQKVELGAIRRACLELQPDGKYQPPITFLVVQKRHHTRFFPTNPSDSEDQKNFNVSAGTCVDTTITNPMMQDYYLVSHASPLGVARPTKYCTIWDDKDTTHDEIEELTYHLCHMFSRCNRSVSYPAPTYYAHLMAARAKEYIEHDNLNLEDLENEQSKYQIKDCIAMGKPMFFV